MPNAVPATIPLVWFLLLRAATAMEAPRMRTNSLGFSCDHKDYPQKSFKRKSAVMVHIPKTGGTSLARWGIRSGYHFDRTDKKHRFMHMRPTGRDTANTTFRFSFVRNPFTRFVSQYTFCASGPHKTWNRGFPCHLVHKNRMPFDEWWTLLWRSILQEGQGQLPSIRAATSSVGFQAGHFDMTGRSLPPRDPQDRPTTPNWCSGIWWGNCFGPVSQWVYENGHSGERVVDWVGRLENFSTDFACLRQLLNDTKPGAPKFRADGRTFHVRNSASASNGTRVSTRYWLRNESLRQLVLKHYADDFDNFGYSREVPP